MCLLLLALHPRPGCKLLLAANRDEYYDRPTAPAEFWKEAPDLLAGKDLRAGGTWLGITRTGRIAAITNFRDPLAIKEHAPSRGGLVTRFLMGDESPGAFIDILAREGIVYNGYNLVLGAQGKFFWYSNRGKGAHALTSGYYGLSNHLLDTPWPKVAWSKKTFTALFSQADAPSTESLFHMLGNRRVATDDSLPDTGVGLEWERILSPVFIASPAYGTRSSTILFIDEENRVTFLERTYHPENPDHHETHPFKFIISP
ncbi:MAG: NRDE family protein [Deltaproteobacteria bacterium]|nr:NRDE family protein [Deltaproteobacteria bacterium]